MKKKVIIVAVALCLLLATSLVLVACAPSDPGKFIEKMTTTMKFTVETTGEEEYTQYFDGNNMGYKSKEMESYFIVNDNIATVYTKVNDKWKKLVYTKEETVEVIKSNKKGIEKSYSSKKEDYIISGKSWSLKSSPLLIYKVVKGKLEIKMTLMGKEHKTIIKLGGKIVLPAAANSAVVE